MKKMPWFILISSIILGITACNNSYDSLIEQFNQKYFQPEQIDIEPYSVKNSGFNPSEMLMPVYTFSEGVCLILEAPQDATSYSWTLVQSDGSSEELGNERFLIYQTPGLFKVREENDLVLTVTVTDANGNVTEYIDRSVIIIRSQTGSDNGGQ